MLSRIAVLASGGGTNLQAILDACARGDIPGKVVCVVYDRKKAYARVRAEQAGVPARYINKLQFDSPEAHDAALLACLKEFDAQVIALAGYLGILGPQTVGAYRNRILNTHPALIPSFCGMGFHGEHVHQAVLDFGAKVSGCTIHFADEGVDAGPIVFQEAVPVLPTDTAETLAARILPHEHALLTRAVCLLCQERIQVEGRQVTILEQPAK